MRHMNTETHCPICQSKNIKELYSVELQDSVIHFSTTGWNNSDDRERAAKLSKNIQSLWKQNNCSVVKCRSCDFVFAWPFIAGDSEFYNLAFDDGYPSNKWEFNRTIECIQKRPDFLDSQVLEVGSGIGRFIEHLLEIGIPAGQIVSTEYSEKGINAIQKLGVKVISEDIRKIAENKMLPSGYFDIVCIFQVVEHMDRLHELMQSMFSLLKPGGHLYIAVPNAARIQFNESNGGLLDIPPNHIGRYSHKNISLLSANNGFKVISQETEPESLHSFMGSFYYQRAIRRLQLHKPNPSKLQKLITFNWHRFKAILNNVPGEAYWVQLQKV